MSWISLKCWRMLNCHDDYKQIARDCEIVCVQKRSKNANELELETVVIFMRPESSVNLVILGQRQLR